MGIEENKEVVRQMWDAYNQGNPMGMGQYMSDNFVRYAPDGTTMDGEGYMKFCESIVQNTSESKVIVDDMVAEGDKVAVRMTLSGGYEGKTYVVKEACFVRIDDGKIVDFYGINTENMWLE